MTIHIANARRDGGGTGAIDNIRAGRDNQGLVACRAIACQLETSTVCTSYVVLFDPVVDVRVTVTTSLGLVGSQE